MARWDPDLALGWPPFYHALIRKYVGVFAFITLTLLYCTLTRAPKQLYTYATCLSGVCTAAMFVRYAQPDWVVCARVLDLWIAEGTLGLCMCLLVGYIGVLEQTLRFKWPHKARLVRYLVITHVCWACSGLTAFYHTPYTLMYLVVCVQWGVYAECGRHVHRQMLTRTAHAKHTSASHTRLSLVAEVRRTIMLGYRRGPYLPKQHTLQCLYALLCLAMVMCIQIMFLVIYLFAEELRDFHKWIIHASRAFSAVFLVLAISPGLIGRFDATSYQHGFIRHQHHP